MLLFIYRVSSSLMFYTIHVLLCLVSFQKVYILPNGGQRNSKGRGIQKQAISEQELRKGSVFKVCLQGGSKKDC